MSKKEQATVDRIPELPLEVLAYGKKVAERLSQREQENIPTPDYRKATSIIPCSLIAYPGKNATAWLVHSADGKSIVASGLESGRTERISFRKAFEAQFCIWKLLYGKK